MAEPSKNYITRDELIALGIIKKDETEETDEREGQTIPASDDSAE